MGVVNSPSHAPTDRPTLFSNKNPTQAPVVTLNPTQTKQSTTNEPNEMEDSKQQKDPSIVLYIVLINAAVSLFVCCGFIYFCYGKRKRKNYTQSTINMQSTSSNSPMSTDHIHQNKKTTFDTETSRN